MRIALAQINPTLGDFHGNAKKIIEASTRAVARGADIVLFPEASLFGYHPMDLLERSSVIQEQTASLNSLVRKLPKKPLIVFGAFTEGKGQTGKNLFNSAVVVQGGKIKALMNKELLPTYDVFDDARHVAPGEVSKNVLFWRGKNILITVCEDIWAWPKGKKQGNTYYSENPLKNVLKSLKLKKGSKRIDLVLNLSASPYDQGKFSDRKKVVTATAKLFKAPVVYVNSVGAQDELIFDGGSFAVDPRGKIICQSLRFAEDLNLFQWTSGFEGSVREASLTPAEELRRALVLGIQDFLAKSGLKSAHLGLSGGIDSALVACLAVDALGAKNVTAIAMPGQFSDPRSLSSARELARNLGVRFLEQPIDRQVENLSQDLSASFASPIQGVTYENLQSRMRALVLMAYANSKGSLLLNTSNKTELATGYSTIYGDLCGGLCVLGDLLKREVYVLARHYNSQAEVIPAWILERPPSAELRPNQKDSDSLPPYDELDQAVERIVDESLPARSDTEKYLLKALRASEFKRWQAPPILKVRRHSFGRGRRFPIAQRSSK
jgi:NAD+ synthase (glutamine-hydrolysing)